MTSFGQNFKSRILEFVLRELYIKSEKTVLSDKLFCPTLSDIHLSEITWIYF
jgi:hypothetical protein